jgi:sugar phosphate isomerase/epimerase
MRFALFSGSTPEWTPRELAAKLVEQGWHGVEWRVVDQRPADQPGFWAGNRATFPFTGLDTWISEITSVTRAAGLDLAAIAAYVPLAERENVERLLSAAAALGARLARVTVPKTSAGTAYHEQFERARRDAAFAAERARHHGVKAVIQLHHGNIVSTSSAARRLLDGLDPNAIGIIHDLGNLTIEGREGLGTHTPGLEILGEYLAHVHVKNVIWTPSAEQADGTVDWSWRWAPLRSGVGDVRSYFRSLREVGYDGWVTVENFTTEGSLEQRVAKDLAYLREAATKAGYPAGI